LWNGVSLTKFTGGVEIDFGVELSADDGFHFDDPNGIASFVTHKRGRPDQAHAGMGR
jgi:hypothetical protein